MTESVAISVIIPVWNGEADLPACLAALAAERDALAGALRLEVIAVDNDSADGSAALIRQHFPWVTLLPLATNRGFAGGCNAGLRHATGDYLILLNQDTEVKPGWAGGLIAPLAQDPAVGITGSLCLYPDGNVQHAGGYVNRRGEGSHTETGTAITPAAETASEPDFVTGASLAIRRNVYAALGPLDEGFGAAYYEDVDWCFRARAAGFRVAYAPASRLIHREVSSRATGSWERIYAFHRNRLRFVLKHWPAARFDADFVEAELRWLQEQGQGAERLLSAVRAAYLTQLAHLPAIGELRRQIHGWPVSELHTLAEGLRQLHRAVSLRPVFYAAASDVAFTPGQALQAVHLPPATPPVAGTWVARLRWKIAHALARPYVQPHLAQQALFNRQMLDVVHGLAFDQHTEIRRLSIVLAEYLHGQAAELDLLAYPASDLPPTSPTDSEPD
jgi:GT2 family glycosyltransferase